MQQMTEDAKAIMLLCGRFGPTKANGSVKPLSLGEYNRLTDWMVDHRLRPADLLKDTFKEAALDPYLKIDGERIQSLLSRGAAMALAVEKWTHNGIWIVCRSDAHYPQRLKKHLRHQAPPVLFGVGDMGLLSLGGLAIVGSRNVDSRGEAFAQLVAQACVQCGMPVVSGGARGVDQIAMLSALEAGGTAVGILADSLQKAAVAGKYRAGIREKRVVLISPFHPEARFNVGNAMGRNKYIYALSDFALAISAEVKKGGTWAGATEELRRDGARPVFVRMEDGAPEGNRALLQHGAKPFPKPPWQDDLKHQLFKMTSSNQQVRILSQRSIFSNAPSPAKEAFVKEDVPSFGEAPEQEIASPQQVVSPERDDSNTLSCIYDVVIPVLLDTLTDWKPAKELVEKLGVRKVQLDDWLTRAVKDGAIEKKSRPVRYRRKQK
jgi:predicted Rossmann fold nucleotide-binding protein DprA/Smf involved in DNA uptake